MDSTALVLPTPLAMPANPFEWCCFVRGLWRPGDERLPTIGELLAHEFAQGAQLEALIPGCGCGRAEFIAEVRRHERQAGS